MDKNTKVQAIQAISIVMPFAIPEISEQDVAEIWNSSAKKRLNQKNRTSTAYRTRHSRDKKGTRQAQEERHSESMYLRGNAHQLRDAISLKEAKDELEYFFIHEEIFDTSADTQLPEKEPICITCKPWENLDLVMYLFEEAASAYLYDKANNVHCTPTTANNIAALRNAVMTGRLAFCGDFDCGVCENMPPIHISNEVFPLLKSRICYDIVDIVRSNLLALSKKPEVHLHYLENLYR